MNLGYVSGRKMNQQIEQLKIRGVEEIFEENAFDIGEVSRLSELLDYSKPGDRVVIVSLEVVSRDYQRLLVFLTELENHDLEFIVLNMPIISLPEWHQLFTWTLRNEKILYFRKSKINTISSNDDWKILLIQRNSEGDKLYRSVYHQLKMKEKPKKIAEKEKIPLESVYQIKKMFQRIKSLGISITYLIFLIVIVNYAPIFLIKIAGCIISIYGILKQQLKDYDQR